MFKKLVILVILTLNGTGAMAASSLKDLECSSSDSNFKVIQTENPRNGANALITDITGAFPFGGVWLWKVEATNGFLSSKSKFKTMNGGVLTISKQVLIGRGGCGRGVCHNELNFITAHFMDSNADEFIYDCHQISL